MGTAIPTNKPVPSTAVLRNWCPSSRLEGGLEGVKITNQPGLSLRGDAPRLHLHTHTHAGFWAKNARMLSDKLRQATVGQD